MTYLRLAVASVVLACVLIAVVVHNSELTASSTRATEASLRTPPPPLTGTPLAALKTTAETTTTATTTAATTATTITGAGNTKSTPTPRTIPLTPSTRPRVPTRQLETSDYEGSIVLLKQLLSLIYNRYEFNRPEGYQLFMATNNIAASSWDLLKTKFATKILSGDPYLMTFAGSSVTAGHDNYYNQSFPLIVKKRMGDIFAKLGVQLEVHNIAHGANPCMPYIYCYETLGGKSPDFVNWEQSYNCGHDDPVFEYVARIVNKGGMVYYSASGAWAPDKCPPSQDAVPYSDEDWTPSAADLPEWDASQANVQDMKTALLKYAQKSPSSKRFTSSFKNDYPSVGFMGFNVWEPNDECNYQKDGKSQHCNGIDAAGGCALNFMSVEASYYGSDNHKGANWHPTRAFHMLRGEAISWIFSLVLLETVRELQERSEGVDVLLKEYQSKLDALPPLSDPKRCSSLHCQQPSTCYTDFRPSFTQGLTLSEHLVGKTKWGYDPVPPKESNLHYGLVDAKPAYEGVGFSAGEIHIRVKVTLGRVLLCGDSKETLVHSRLMLDKNVPEGEAADYTPSADRTEITTHTEKGNECREYEGIPPGSHVISLSTREEEPSHRTSLTHVIAW